MVAIMPPFVVVLMDVVIVVVGALYYFHLLIIVINITLLSITGGQYMPELCDSIN